MDYRAAKKISTISLAVLTRYLSVSVRRANSQDVLQVLHITRYINLLTYLLTYLRIDRQDWCTCT